MSKKNVLCAVTPLFVFVLATAQATADTAKLNGVWKVESGQHRGKDMPEEIRKRFVFTFEGGNRFTIQKRVGRSTEFSYVADLTVDPHKITFEDTDPDGKKGKAIGFFKLDNGKLKLWIPNRPNEDDPPKSLEDKQVKDSFGHFVLVKESK